MNRCILVGRLGQAVELKRTGNNVAVANFSMATTEWSKDKQLTEWHRIIVWDKQAESCAKYLNKGSQVAVEGRIQTRAWTDKTGNKRTSTEIVATKVEFLNSKKEAQEQEQKEPVTNDHDQRPGDDVELDAIPF